MIRRVLIEKHDKFDLVEVYRNDKFIYRTAVQHKPPTIEQNLKVIRSLGMEETNQRIGGKKRKFNNEQVKDIKVRIASGEQMNKIAKEYGVSASTIRNIKIGISYNDVKLKRA